MFDYIFLPLIRTLVVISNVSSSVLLIRVPRHLKTLTTSVSWSWTVNVSFILLGLVFCTTAFIHVYIKIYKNIYIFIYININQSKVNNTYTESFSTEMFFIITVLIFSSICPFYPHFRVFIRINWFFVGSWSIVAPILPELIFF